MYKNIGYDRSLVLDYATKWSLSRNPLYYNFDGMGGDCTNFASQCIFAGCGIMNKTPVMGWYYKSPSDRTPSWSGVKYLRNFLITNYDKPESPGPYAMEVGMNSIEIGDIAQLGNVSGDFHHSLVITGFDYSGIYVSAHTFDTFMRPLDSYYYDTIRFLHIAGCRKQV